MNRRIGLHLLASILFVSAAMPGLGVASADEPVTLSIAIKDQKFEPAELHAPAGKQIAIRVKNLGAIVSEFESSALHVEKIVPAGGEVVVYVRPQQPGRYNFFDDFHHDTQGFLVVP